ncbi:MAG: hypothetical protein EOO51_13200 [Flavobacterium sp.]|nr:MAG: hypothetical protein EOO51_13200 [Flavobacterium sp.]
MKKIHITFLLVFASLGCYAQSEKTLDETKAYIVKMINEHGFKQNSDKRRLRAEFDGNLLKIFTENGLFGKSMEDEAVYNFANVYKYKGPMKKPGDIAEIIIWVDQRANERNNKWVKQNFEMDIHNYEIGQQLMIAFRHLNKLLLESKPAIEKF